MKSSPAPTLPALPPGLRRWRWHPLWALVALPGAAFGLRLAMAAHWPLPFCWLRRFTGIPCPACGCTRSLAAWAHGDLLEAFRFNPLFFVACLGLAGWAVLRTVEEISGSKGSARWTVMARRRRWRWGVLVLAVGNWLYLCLHLPK